MEAATAGIWSKEFGSLLTGVMFVWLTLRQLLGSFDGVVPLRRWSEKLLDHVNPFDSITFPEFCDGRYKRSAAFGSIESYLFATCGGAARRLRGELDKHKAEIAFSMDRDQEVVDFFEGASMRWFFSVTTTKSSNQSYRGMGDKRSYILTFSRRHRRLVVGKYLRFVMKKGKELTADRRQRRLFTNSSNAPHEKLWSHVPFEHPASFETLAMEPAKKEELVKDLITFRESRDYYARVGKAWKRGYLLHGPPGTGKSTLIAAMANLLDYDVYDLELTAVKDNSSLRALLMEMSGKSIMVVEDIDCSLALTGRRRKNDGDGESESDGERESESESESGKSKVTLSGLLNFIDGLWSASAGERIVVFTTNHVDELDPALIRPGRMDVHVELSYCRFGAFRVLARNYLGVEEHPLFADVRRLIEEVDATPADVAERLMPGSRRGSPRLVEECLRALLRNLQEKKAQAQGKALPGDDSPRSINFKTLKNRLKIFKLKKLT